MGYWVAKDMRGKGICSEAVVLGLRFAFRTLGLNRVYAHVFPGNAASARVLEKAGFTFEGILRKSARHRGRYRDNQLYSILRSEFKTRR
jgi:ribosomal-protein-alanine N-acetyltransferase